MSIEFLAQMVPMWALGGLAIAWLAEAFWSAGGHGLLTDIVFGIGGSVAAGMLIATTVPFAVGMFVMFAVGCTGAIVPLLVQRGLWRTTSARSSSPGLTLKEERS